MANIKNSHPKSTKRSNTILDLEDFLIIDGEFVLTDEYYKKHGKINPKKQK